MKRPNRSLFERQIAPINEQISTLDADYKSLVGVQVGPGNDNLITGLIGRHHADRNRLKTERDALRTQVRNVNVRLDDFQKKIKVCKEDISKLESDDLYYKDENKLAAYLKRLEHQYNSMQTRNVREEKALVTQIDKAKRNQKQLVKWRKLMAEKEDMVKQLHELKSEKEMLYRKSNDTKSAELASRNMERECKTKAQLLTADLEILYKNRQSLIIDYEQECKLYADYCKNGNKLARKDECPAYSQNVKQQVQRTSSGKRQVKKSFSNDEYHSDESDGNDYEPFLIEKGLCNSLLIYVQKFLICDGFTIPIESNGQNSRSDFSVAADNEAESIVNLPLNENFEINAEVDECYFAVPAAPKILKKKCSNRKDKRRLTQPIPHAPEVFNDFERLDLKAPVNYSELNIVLEKLKDKLKYYEDQTLLPLNFSYNVGNFSYATSESELTVDTDSYQLSVLSLSEDSFSVRNLSQNSASLSKNRSIGSEIDPKSPPSNLMTQSPFSIDKTYSFDKSSPIIIERPLRLDENKTDSAHQVIRSDEKRIDSARLIYRVDENDIDSAHLSSRLDEKRVGPAHRASGLAENCGGDKKRALSLVDFPRLTYGSRFDWSKRQRSRSCETFFVSSRLARFFTNSVNDEGFCSKGSTT